MRIGTGGQGHNEVEMIFFSTSLIFFFIFLFIFCMFFWVMVDRFGFDVEFRGVLFFLFFLYIFWIEKNRVALLVSASTATARELLMELGFSWRF